MHALKDSRRTQGHDISPLAFVQWLLVLGFDATLTAKVISWRSVTHVFPGFPTPVLTQLFLPKPPTTFLTCFCRGETQKYAGKKSRLNRGSNSQPPGHESDLLTTEPPGRGLRPVEQTTITINICHYDRIRSSLTTVHCFHNGYVGKQPVAWTEY